MLLFLWSTVATALVGETCDFYPSAMIFRRNGQTRFLRNGTKTMNEKYNIIMRRRRCTRRRSSLYACRIHLDTAAPYHCLHRYIIYCRLEFVWIELNLPSFHLFVNGPTGFCQQGLCIGSYNTYRDVYVIHAEKWTNHACNELYWHEICSLLLDIIIWIHHNAEEETKIFSYVFTGNNNVILYTSRAEWCSVCRRKTKNREHHNSPITIYRVIFSVFLYVCVPR